MVERGFEAAYGALNDAQRHAVETIEGPVMVVAGPGTGKTQVLALRIATILQKTDVGADAILCLTFTRSGVHAMNERLERYIGTEARKVHVATFHSFAGDLIEQYHQLLSFDTIPQLLDETHAVLLVDELLHEHEWEHIRPRTNPAQYFGDLKQLISLLKRERMTPEAFLMEVEGDIVSLKEDPESISSRGESKGKLKKEIEKKIDSLERTKEVVAFYQLYEAIKKERALMDYDDVLEYAVALAESSEEVRGDIRETYQYVLIDEHQDSSGVQNEFLKAVWKETEQPNIFVVGDDRQLIYGFSGASLSYFEEFKTLFGKATLITLSDNYRSTAPILSLADSLLQSTVSKETLRSNRGGGDAVGLFEYAYERDEILGAAQQFKKIIAQGAAPETCALLVPKNRHVKNAIALLQSQGLPVATTGGESLFTQQETQVFLRTLHTIVDPYNHRVLAESLLDTISDVPPLEAHAFLHSQKGKEFSLETLCSSGNENGLFAGTSAIASWGTKLKALLDECAGKRPSECVAIVGNELFISRKQSHEALLRSVEIVRSLLHAVLAWEERHSGEGMKEFLSYIGRLQTYHHDIPLASFAAAKGVQVMTLHKSKGLEYDTVWVAHMNEETLMAQKRMPFTLPEAIRARLEERDRAAATRELYVAITRAKTSCSISYAQSGYDGRELTLSEIIADLPKTHIEVKDAQITEQELLEGDPMVYTGSPVAESNATTADVVAFVQERYPETKVSVTLLNNFFECPWKWYFRNFLKLPEVKSVSLALGSAVHSTIETLLKSKVSETIAEILETELKKEGVANEKELKRLIKDGERAVGQWMKEYYPHLAENRASERSLQYKDGQFPHLQLYGKIDLTERFPDGTMIVTDFKTGSVKTPGVIEKESEEGRLSDYMRQLAMYSYLIRGAEEKEVHRSRLLFVEADAKEKNACYETHVGDEQIDLLIRDIKEYDALLKSGAWVNRDCYYKGYGTQTECEYCKLAKVFKK